MTTPEDTKLTATKLSTSTIVDSRFNRFDNEFIDKWFNEQGKQAIKDYITLHTEKSDLVELIEQIENLYLCKEISFDTYENELADLDERIDQLTNPTEAGEK